MVGFQHQNIAPLQVIAYIARQIAQVSGNGNFYAFGSKSESDGICGVVGNGESCDGNIPDRESLSCGESFQPAQLRSCAGFVAHPDLARERVRFHRVAQQQRPAGRR